MKQSRTKHDNLRSIGANFKPFLKGLSPAHGAAQSAAQGVAYDKNKCCERKQQKALQTASELDCRAD
jgi:hypothetical protein